MGINPASSAGQKPGGRAEALAPQRRLCVIFLGTPEFAVPTLDRIVASGHAVSLVVTQPDRPKGRKQELVPSPVKAAALRHAIPVYQPERIRCAEALAHFKELSPEVMVVVGYGQIIPQSIIDLAPWASSTSTHRCCLSCGAPRPSSGRSRGDTKARA